MPWDTLELYKTPKIDPTDSCKQEGFQSFFYEGLEYKAVRTRVFAYYKTPTGQPPAGGWPAVICVHGGGGTAFPAWVQAWVDHGYAAIAMDLEGHLPKGDFPNREGHAYGGPPRITTFGDIELADREQWFYHAVADVIKAHSLLRTFPEINPQKIGIHGISWGGVIASAVIGIDHRLAFAIPVYGCGFLYQTTSPGFKKYFDTMTPGQLSAYKTKWDPSLYLPDCTIPVLFYIGTNDGAFPLDIWQRSVLLTRGRTMQCVPVSSEHGHIWNQPEIFAFADASTGKGSPLPQIGKAESIGRLGFADLSRQTAIARCTLIYTTDSCDWQHRQWSSVPAQRKGDRVFLELPEGTKAFYFNITNRLGLTFSSSFKETDHEETNK